jgi:hypothetical protein
MEAAWQDFRPFQPESVEHALGSGRRVSPNARSAAILRRRHPPKLQPGMRRPSDSVVVPEQ